MALDVAERLAPLTASPDTGALRRKSNSRRTRRNTLIALCFIAPSFIGFLAFTVGPLIASLVVSLFDWNLISSPTFVGIGNYVKLFTADPKFMAVLGNTVLFVIGAVPLSVVLGLAVALLLNAKIKFVSIFRAAYFVPVVISVVASALVWKWLFNSDAGVINSVLSAVGVQHPPEWLASTAWALPAVIIVSIWKNVGYNMVIYLAGLKNIPAELLEAAAIDGASRWQQLWYVTVPMLRPTTFFITVISIINSFQVFGLALIMTNGGPGTATNTIVFYIYQQGFQNFSMGYASAIGWVLFALILVVTLVQGAVNRAQEK
jgi:multiple sugar transport system permease protein